MMNERQFDEALESGLLDDVYADYIMENSRGDRSICNGDDLLDAMEDLYLFEEFKQSLTNPVN